MSLDNLVGITLEKLTPDSSAISRLLNAAKRNIADAQITDVSAENRFDAAYKAIMQLANAALQVRGYRTLTSSCWSTAGAVAPRPRQIRPLLTSSRYAGAQAAEDDGEAFVDKMQRLSAQWREQQIVTVRLDAAIEANLRELGHGG